MSFASVSSAVSIVLVALLPGFAVADGYALFSKHEELKRHVVVDAGDFERVVPNDGSLPASVVVKLNSNCFQALGALSSWGFGKKAGLVLVDREKSIRIALLEASVGSIKVETVQVVRVSCSSGGAYGSSIDLDEREQQLNRLQELFRAQQEQVRQLRQPQR